MLRWISIFGGLLIMMGSHVRSEALFYYFRLEDQVPESHLLRLIDKCIGFEFVRRRLKDSYSETGRPSIDPELLLRILLIGYLYGISSEASWWKNCACIWRGAGSPVWGSIRRSRITPPSQKTGMGGLRNRSCLSSCSRRSYGSVWKWDWCKGTICRCMGSSSRRTHPRRAAFLVSNYKEAAQVNHMVRQYVQELEQQNRLQEPVHEQDQVSTTDPNSTYATKGGTPALLGYYDNSIWSTTKAA
jgi:hypothetical protein